MENLGDEIWDVVLAGTSLPQALLALSLSKSGLKILHVDKNEFYGGVDAGLSLDEAEKLALESHENGERKTLSSPSIEKPEGVSGQLGSSRSYTLSLNPQIIYAQSSFLPSLVSSQIHTQLEFHAVGSWWIYKDKRLQKIPSTREDVFADESLSQRDKRGLMKLLRFVAEDQDEAVVSEMQNLSLETALNDNFKLPKHLQTPILALALANDSATETKFVDVAARIRRHIRSVGYFGPGFGSVIAKYGSNAEIAQVACRACAVGGATYLLGHGVEVVGKHDDEGENLIEVQLSNGTKVKSRYLVGSANDLPATTRDPPTASTTSPQGYRLVHQIAVVSNPLSHLFPQPVENGSVPAAAVILVDDGHPNEPPLYLQVHSEDTGECPQGQCIMYATTIYKDDTSITRLSSAIEEVVKSGEESASSEVLWKMSYLSSGMPHGSKSANPILSDVSGRIITFPSRTHDIAFDDALLDSVKAAWQRVLNTPPDEEFMRFEERRIANEDD